MRNITGLVLNQIVLKYLIGIAAYALLDQKACKVGARDQFGIAGIHECAFIATRNTRFSQLLSHHLGAILATIPSTA